MCRSHLFVACVSFIAISAGLALFSVASEYRTAHRLRQHVSAQAIEERLSGAFAAMNDFPGSVGKDLQFLRTLSSISELYVVASVEARQRAHKDVRQFIEHNVAYDEVRLHDPACLFAAQRAPEAVGDASCTSQNKIVDDVVAKTLAVPRRSVYVSPLFAYRHAVEGEKSVIPAILYGTRIPASDPARDGVILAVVNANYFLEEVRRLARPGESVYLVNTDGSYVAHPERKKEVIVGGTANFYDDFPSVPAGVLSDEAVRSSEYGGSIFTFLRIAPTASNFTLYDGSDQDRASGYWVLVAVSEKYAAGRRLFSLSSLATMGMIALAHSFVVLLIFFVLFPSRSCWAIPADAPEA